MSRFQRRRLSFTMRAASRKLGTWTRRHPGVLHLPTTRCESWNTRRTFYNTIISDTDEWKLITNADVNLPEICSTVSRECRNSCHSQPTSSYYSWCFLLLFFFPFRYDRSCRKLERAKKDNKLKGVFYFTHSQTMILFFTLMNIGKDDVPITASNFRNMGHRNWRTSLLVPFATNVAAVFYR